MYVHDFVSELANPASSLSSYYPTGLMAHHRRVVFNQPSSSGSEPAYALHSAAECFTAVEAAQQTQMLDGVPPARAVSRRSSTAPYSTLLAPSAASARPRRRRSPLLLGGGAARPSSGQNDEDVEEDYGVTPLEQAVRSREHHAPASDSMKSVALPASLVDSITKALEKVDLGSLADGKVEGVVSRILEAGLPFDATTLAAIVAAVTGALQWDLLQVTKSSTPETCLVPASRCVGPASGLCRHQVDSAGLPDCRGEDNLCQGRHTAVDSILPGRDFEFTRAQFRSNACITTSVSNHSTRLSFHSSCAQHQMTGRMVHRTISYVGQLSCNGGVRQDSDVQFARCSNMVFSSECGS